MPRRILSGTLAATLVFGASAIQAADFSDKVKVRGFGTLGFTHSTEERGDFTNSMQQLDGPGFSNDWGFGLDSKVGLQANIQITDKLSAVVQGIIKEQYDGEFRPGIEWANLSYAITSDFKVRVGRIVSPTLMYSDSVYVGYSYVWARPPVDVYYGLPFTNLDGVDLTYNTNFGNLSAQFQGAVGKTEAKFPSATNVAIGDVDVSTVNAAFEYGNFAWRVAATRYVLEVDSYENAADIYNSLGLSYVADHYFSTEPGFYYDLGATYDNGSLVAAAELAISRRKHVQNEGGKFGYLSLGYRVQDFTPFVRVGYRNRDASPLLGAAYAPAQPIVNGIITGGEDSQQSYTVGTRWDFAPGKALKLQASHVSPEDGSKSTLMNVQPDYVRGRSYNLYSLNLDFVF